MRSGHESWASERNPGTRTARGSFTPVVDAAHALLGDVARHLVTLPTLPPLDNGRNLLALTHKDVHAVGATLAQAMACNKPFRSLEGCTTGRRGGGTVSVSLSLPGNTKFFRRGALARSSRKPRQQLCRPADLIRNRRTARPSAQKYSRGVLRHRCEFSALVAQAEARLPSRQGRPTPSSQSRLFARLRRAAAFIGAGVGVALEVRRRLVEVHVPRRSCLGCSAA